MKAPDLRKHPSAQAAAAARAAEAAAWVSGLFSLSVFVLMAAHHLQMARARPLDDVSLASLKKKLAENPGDEDLRRSIRTLDLLARRAYFAFEEEVRTGRILLLVGTLVFLASLRLRAALRARLPAPPEAPVPRETPREKSWARRAILAGGTTLAAVAGVWVVLEPPPPPSLGAPPAPASAWAPTRSGPLAPAPEAEPPAERWPNFRGPEGRAVAPPEALAPLSWDGRSGQNILWKAAVPLPGPNSPVLWGSRVFLTGSDGRRCEVFAFDAATGALLWRRGATEGNEGTGGSVPEVMKEVGLAAPTAATDGRRLAAIFATGWVVAFDFEGRRVFSRHLGTPRISYGYASSLLIEAGRILIQWDDPGGPRLLALEAATGRTLWEQARPVRESWATPILLRRPSGTEVVLAARPWVAAYDVATGEKRWGLECFDRGEVAPSPAFNGEYVFAGTQDAGLLALRPGPSAAIVWRHGEDVPDVSSPVATDRYVFLASSSGTVTCLEARTGSVLWSKDWDDGFHASPVAVGDRVYLTDRSGVTLILRASASWEVLGKNPLGEKVVGTPAFGGGRIYLRSDRHLWCIAENLR